MPTMKVTVRSEVKLCLRLCCLSTSEANLTKLHRKIKHNENVCVGSYAQGQVCNQVRDQNSVSSITQKLLKQIYSNFTERENIMRMCVAHRIRFLRPRSRSQSCQR